MQSLRELYRIGHGPSSSHTIGPNRAMLFLLNKYTNAVQFNVTLYGSLAFTGRGHLTDRIIVDTVKPLKCIVTFDYKTKVDFPNTFDVEIVLKDGSLVNKRVLSLGGGRISISDEPDEVAPDIYPEKNFAEIAEICLKNSWQLWNYVEHYEGKEIWQYLRKVWHQMIISVDRGLKANGYLPGKLHIKRRAASFMKPAHPNESIQSRSYRLISGYAFAVGEENASGGLVATAPTCGASATLPSVLKFLSDQYGYNEDEMIHALAAAGVIGNVVKHNGSISGAEAGCQAEIGTASAMAAAACCDLKHFRLDQIEYAAESALEHSLGLTCDPVGGYVQIPCIERNAIAALQALATTHLAEYITDSHRVSFDTVVLTMRKTGLDMNKRYRETSRGGLAKEVK